jgi:hypothetical protein
LHLASIVELSSTNHPNISLVNIVKMGERIYLTRKEIREFKVSQTEALYEVVRELDNKKMRDYAKAYEVVVTNNDRSG